MGHDPTMVCQEEVTHANIVKAFSGCRMGRLPLVVGHVVQHGRRKDWKAASSVYGPKHLLEEAGQRIGQ